MGSGHAVSIGELLDTMLDLSDEQITVKQNPARLRPSDVPVIEADVSRLRADTGWMPEYTLEQTLRSMLDSNRRNFGLI